jgi:hypothetical protein
MPLSLRRYKAGFAKMATLSDKASFVLRKKA